jgi:type I restriction enzyme S subunit
VSGNNEDGPGQLSDGWEWATFSDVATIASSLVSPKEWGGFPHVAPDNIERDTGRLLPYRTISEDGVTSPKHLFKPGQLLYSKIRPYLNKCVRVDFWGLCSADMYPLDARINAAYLHCYILSRQFVSAVSEASGSRTVLPKANQEQLSEVPIPVAPLREQHRISEAIESYFTRLDDAVGTLERVERNLKRYRESVLKAAVEGRLVPTEAALAKQEGCDYEPASILLERILAERRRRWSESGKKGKYQEPTPPDIINFPDLPEGWCWATVDQVCSHIVDCPHSTPMWADIGYVCVRTTEFLPGRLNLAGARFVSRATYEERIQRLRPEPGDVLYSREGGILGIACRVPQGIELCLGQRMMLMRAARPAYASYLMHLLNSPLILERVRALIGGSASPHLNVGDIRGFAVPLPPEAEAVRISSAIDDIFLMVESADAVIAASLSRSVRLRQSTLKWAFEGKLVDQNPDDEPASVLLERIKAERASSKPAKEGRAPRSAGKKQVRA